MSENNLIDTFFMVTLGAWLSMPKISLGFANTQIMQDAAEVPMLSRLSIVLAALFFFMWRFKYREGQSNRAIDKKLEKFREHDGIIPALLSFISPYGLYRLAEYFASFFGIAAALSLLMDKCFTQLLGWTALFALWWLFGFVFQDFEFKGNKENENDI